MTEHRRTRWIAWIVLVAAACALPLAAAEAPPPAAVPALQQPAPAMSPAVSSPAQQGIESIFLAQCLPPCLSCPSGFTCKRNANGCLVCVRCTNPDPRFCPSGG
jgi:hypothetical protein